MTLKPAFFALALISTACSTVQAPSLFSKFDELEISRDFSGQTIATRPFALNTVGLERASNSDDALGAPTLSSQAATLLLSEQFQSLRPDLQLHHFNGTGTTQKKLDEILKHFAPQQELSKEGYSFLQKAPWQETWFLIADLEQDRTEQNVQEETIKDEKGTEIAKKRSFITSRWLDVRYFVYDSSKQRLVFSGLVRSKSQATRDQIQTESESQALWNTITGVKQNTDNEFPEAPGFKKALMQNFQKFVAALPHTQG